MAKYAPDVTSNMSYFSASAKFTPSQLIESAKTQGSFGLLDLLSQDPKIEQLYSLDAGIWERQTIREHTRLVLDRARRYSLGAHQLPKDWEQSHLLVLMAFHDLGKVLPPTESFSILKEAQHERTLALLQSYAHLLPFSDHQLEVAKLLIEGDPIGKLFRTVCPRRPTQEYLHNLSQNFSGPALSLGQYLEAVNDVKALVESSYKPEVEAEAISLFRTDIATKASSCKLTYLEFLRLQVSYYQSDCAAYTLDARDSELRGKFSMDFLFELNPKAESAEDNLLNFDPALQRLRFSTHFEKLYRQVEQPKD